MKPDHISAGHIGQSARKMSMSLRSRAARVTPALLVFIDADEVVSVSAASHIAAQVNDPTAIVGTYKRSTTCRQIEHDLIAAVSEYRAAFA